MSTCTTEYFVGQGKVLIATRTSGGSRNSGFTAVGDAPRLEVSVSQDFLDVEESCSGNRNTALHVPISTQWSMALDMHSFSKENLARALYGTGTAVTGAAVSNEAVTAYALSEINPLKYPKVSAVSINQVGELALTVDVDYTVDLVNGTFTLINATNMVGAAPWSMEVDYTFADAEVVEAAVNTISEYEIRFEGINLATQKPVIATLRRVSMNMSETLSLLGTEQQVFTLGGMLLPDPDAAVGESEYITITKQD